MTRRTYQADSFRARSLLSLTGRNAPSRRLDSAQRTPGASGLFVHKCDIERAAITNVDGEAVHEWEVFAEETPCMIQEKSGIYVNARDGRAIEYNAIGFLPVDCEIRAQGSDFVGDRIVWLDLDPTVTFVVLLAVDESGMADHLTCYLRKFPSAG